jgi:hypothetical protein
LRRFHFIAAVLVGAFAHAQPSLAKPPHQSSFQQRSAELSRSYLRSWSSDTRAALADVHRLYAPRVRFYGRVLNRRELAQEKARFARRWPVRKYAHQPGTMRVSCGAAARKCMVRSVIDWRTANLTRRVASAGSSRFEQGIGFAPRSAKPAVFYENGSVISKRKKTSRG